MTTGDLEFYRERVAIFGMIGTAIGAFAVVAQLGLALTVDGYADPTGPATWLVIAGGAAPAAMAAVGSQPDAGERTVELVETTALLFSTMAYSAALLWLHPGHHFERLLVLALTMIAMLRTMMVPSTTRRTALIVGAMGIPMLLATAALYWNYVPVAGDPLSATHGPVTMAAWSLVWWAPTVVICALTSRLIYGLRSEIRAAKQLGAYVLEQKIGEGAMGEVYRARHALLKRPTALKLVPPERAASATTEQFEREVQLTSRLSHPNTITIFDYGRTASGILYYAMELLDGATLSEVMKVSGPQEPSRVAHILRCTLGALAEAHEVGLVHRDVKAANVMLCTRAGERDYVKLLDFGLAHLLESAPETMQGTPLYLSPESIAAPETVDARHDLYAVGVLAYYLLTGHHPFSGETFEEVCRAHLAGTSAPISSHVTRTMPAGLESWIASMIARDVGQRVQTAEDALASLEALAIAPWTTDDRASWWDAFGPYIEEQRGAHTFEATERTLLPRGRTLPRGPRQSRMKAS